MLAFKIVIAHIPGSTNYAADFCSRERQNTNNVFETNRQSSNKKMLMLKLKGKNLDFELIVLLTTKNFGDERNSNELYIRKKLELLWIQKTPHFLNQKLMPFYKLLKKDAIKEITEGHVKAFEIITENPMKANMKRCDYRNRVFSM